MGCDTCVWGAGDARGRRLGRGHSTDFPSLERWEAVASGQLVSLLGTQDAEATGVCDGRSAGVLGGWRQQQPGASQGSVHGCRPCCVTANATRPSLGLRLDRQMGEARTLPVVARSPLWAWPEAGTAVSPSKTRGRGVLSHQGCGRQVSLGFGSSGSL